MTGRTAAGCWRLGGVAVALAVLQGCSGMQAGLQTGMPSDCQMPGGEGLARVDLRRLTDELADELCGPAQRASAAADDVPPQAVLVPDLVDVQSLQAEALGLSLGDLFRASVATVCKLPVLHPELAGRVRLNAAGLNALTRDHAEARLQRHAVATALVATYHVQDARFTVVARQLDIASSSVVSAAVREVSLGCRRTMAGKPEFVYRFEPARPLAAAPAASAVPLLP